MNIKNSYKIILLLMVLILVRPEKQAFAANEKEIMLKYGEYLYANYMTSPQEDDATFTFIDVDGDKQKELVVCFALSTNIYSYENGVVRLVDLKNEYRSALYFSEDKKSYYFAESNGPFLAYYTISIKNHVATRKNEVRSTSINDYTDEYTFNGKVISADKYDSLERKYYGTLYMDSSVKGKKLTPSNIKKYCGYTDGENSSLEKVKNLDLSLEYVKEDYAYKQIFTWNAVSGADGYELYRKLIDVRLHPFARISATWLSAEWEVFADTKTNQVIKPGFRRGDKFNLYMVRAYKLVNGSKVYGPYGETIFVDEFN